MRRGRAQALIDRAGWGAGSALDLPHVLALAGQRLGAWWRLELDRRRLFNWLPVAMGAGVLLYFAADVEPGLLAPMLGFAVAAGLALFAGRHPALRAALVATAFVFLGFAAGVWRTAHVAAPVLDRIRSGALAGFIESVEVRPSGARIFLRPTGFADLPAERLPARVRFTTAAGEAKPGDHVSIGARLLPPPPPSHPGGYDFARDAYFRGIGAVGSTTGALTMTPPPGPPPADLALIAAIDRARNHLTERIARAIGGQAGAVSAALVTGKRGLITEETNDALRAAGIYHVVSISGLHMVMAAGSIFWLVRALLALSSTAALFWPIKKIAALAAMAGASAYCVFSGSEVATERSLIMTLVMLGAILVDRPALSMRNLAIAALVVLAREPETLLGPSFQMSFGAVTALIAVAERVREKAPSPGQPPWPVRVARLVGIAIAADLLTTLVATAATAPFGVYHFHTVNPYGLLGNALALPFVSFIVMPAALAGVLLHPFGLDAVAWKAMGWASQQVLTLAAFVQNLEGSTLVLPAFGASALLALALALLWITLWTTPIRLVAAAPLALGLWLAATPPHVDGFVERSGAGAAIRGADGRLAILGRVPDFTREQWRAAAGDGGKPDPRSLSAPVRCDAEGCILPTEGGRSVAYARTRRAVAEDCARAGLVITPLYWRGSCAAPLIDRSTLDATGALALQRTQTGWRAMGARGGEDRPWSGARRLSAQPDATPVAPRLAPARPPPPPVEEPGAADRDLRVE